jgi:hypothetical protein
MFDGFGHERHRCGLSSRAVRHGLAHLNAAWAIAFERHVVLVKHDVGVWPAFDSAAVAPGLPV